MKRILCLVLALVLTMSLSMTILADADLTVNFTNHIDSGLDIATIDLPVEFVEGDTVTIKIKGTADANFRVYLGNGVYPTRESDIVTVEVVDGAFETEVSLVAYLAETASVGIVNNIAVKGASYGIPVPNITWEYITLVSSDETEEEFSFTVEKMDDTTMYSIISLNVRSGPSTDFERINALDEGEAVTVTGRASNGWYQVVIDGVVGYVNDIYMTTEAPEIEKDPEVSEDPDSDEDAYKSIETSIGTLEGVSVEIESLPIGKTLDTGDTIVLHFIGTSNGSFRCWLGSGLWTSSSDIFRVEDTEFDILTELTVIGASADSVVFKGPSYGVNLDDLTISYCGVFYGTMAEYEAALEAASSGSSEEPVQPDVPEQPSEDDNTTDNEITVSGKTYVETVIYDTDYAAAVDAWSWNTTISYNTTPTIGDVVAALQEENVYVKIVASNTSAKVILQSEAGNAGLNAPTFTVTEGDNTVAYYLGTDLIDAYIAGTGATIEDGFWNLVIQPASSVTISDLEIVNLTEITTDGESDSNTAKVYFDANGGSGTMEPLTLTKGEYFSIWYGLDCEFTPPEGKVFGGWSATMGGEWFGAGAVTDDVYVTAIWDDPLITSLNCYLEFPVAGNNPDSALWTMNSSYKYEYLNWLVLTDDGWVTFDGAFESGKTYSVTIELSTVYDHVFDAPENYLENSYFMDFRHDGSIPSQTQLTFDSIYANGDNLVIYKEFTLESDSNVVKIHFDANGGSGTMEPLTLAKGDYIYPASIVCEFAPPEGYIFLSWNVTDADGNYVNPYGQNVSQDLYMTANWTPELIGSLSANVEFPITGLGTSFSRTIYYNSYQTDTFTWEVLDGDSWVSFDGIFEEGKTYRVSIKLEPINGAYFDDASVYTNVNVYDTNRGSWEAGASVIADEVYADGDNMVIVKEFTPIVKNVVSVLEFDEFALPEYGTTIGEWLPSVVDGLGYSASGATVYTMPKNGTTWTACTAEDVYISDNYYYYQVNLAADDSSCFNNSDSLNVSISGVSSDINVTYGYNWPSSRYLVTANIMIDGISNTAPEADSNGVILSEETEFFTSGIWNQYETEISTADFVSALATPGAYFVITRSEPCTGVDYPDVGFERFMILDSFWSGSYPQSDGTTSSWLSLGTGNHTKKASIADGYPDGVHIDCVLDDGLNVWYDASEILEAWIKGNLDVGLANLLVVSNTSASDVYDIVRIAVVIPEGGLDIPEEPEDPIEPEDPEVIASGTCGDNLTWTLTDDGTLTISGTGDMYDYYWYRDENNYVYYNAPWYDYRSSIDSVVIEEGITNIGNRAFELCSNIKSVDLPDTLISIGEYAFDWCLNLNSIELPDGLTTIGFCAFNLCEALTDIVIPESVTSIEAYAFAYTGITEITIPASVENIGWGVFRSCQNLTDIHVDADNEFYTDIDGVLFNKSITTIISHPAGRTNTTYEIPSTVTYIEDDTFSGCTNLTAITLHNSELSIGVYAFSNCTSLTSIMIPEKAKEIDMFAFSSCTGLESITFLSTFTKIHDDEYTIPESTVIYGYDDSTAEAYAEKYGRTFVSLGEAPAITGTCGDNLAWELTSNGTLTISGEGEMTDYTGYVNNDDGSQTYHGAPWYDYNNIITKVIVEEGVTSIGNHAMRMLSNLTSVSLPKSLIRIGEFAFDRCTNLTDISIPAGVTTIERVAFQLCESLTSIVLPEGITAIEEYTFGSCSMLEYINIPDGVTHIGQFAFGGCYELDGVNIPEGVVFIGQSAFMYTKLSSINIPSTVTSIGSGAFVYCDYLTDVDVDVTNKFYTDINGVLFDKSVTELIVYPALKTDESYVIPDTVTLIHDHAFYGAINLSELTISKNVAEIGAYALGPCPALLNVYVDSENIAYTDIDGVLFDDGASELILYPAGRADKNYSIPDGVITVKDYAFYSCVDLESVVLPSSLKYINEGAFYDCSSLAHITIPASVESVGTYAFGWCDSLESITFLSDATEIYDNEYTISDTAIIYGYTGSTAEAYAEKCGRTFVPLDEFDEDYILYSEDCFFFSASEWSQYSLEVDSSKFASSLSVPGAQLTITRSAPSDASLADGGFEKFILTDSWWSGNVGTDDDGNVINSIRLGTGHHTKHDSTVAGLAHDVAIDCLSDDGITVVYDANEIYDLWVSGGFMNGAPTVELISNTSSTAYDILNISIILPSDASEEETPTGNLNGDNIVDKDDALHLLYHIIYPETYHVAEDCDYNNDGAVDRNDALYLLYHAIFGESVYPLS